MIQTINGIDLLILLVGIAFGVRFGIVIQRARDYEQELNRKEDFNEWLNGQPIIDQMRRDGWNL
jgi:glucose-6-phosphate-specific signal transduction histidine kinase